MARGLKLGIIGAGAMGKNHLRIAISIPGIKVVGIADKDLALAEKLAAEFGTHAFPDISALIQSSDAICIVTPTSTHHELASTCLKAGKHVLVEKPFTGNSALAKELMALAKDNNVYLTVGLIERFNPVIKRLQKEIKGEKILGIDIKRFSLFPARITDTNVIFDMMIHDLDLLLTLIPGEISHLSASGKKIKTSLLDSAQATIMFESGVAARVEADRTADKITRKLAVTTEKQLVEADLYAKCLILRDFSTPIPSTIPVKPVDQLTMELQDFIQTIKSGTPYPTATLALKSLILAEEVQKKCL
ncbi:MAG: Gfo/Idh/MocA family oxidoreductase [Candidatus Margulisiibacteriota bacterium]